MIIDIIFNIFHGAFNRKYIFLAFISRISRGINRNMVSVVVVLLLF